MTELQNSLNKCRIEGNVLFLPPITEEPISNYGEVKKALQNAGAVYKKNSFVFPNSAQPYIDKLMGGEKINIKKQFQFYATPPEIAAKLVQLAQLKDGMSVLEPSAGQGAIIEQIYNAFPRYCKGPNDPACVTVDYFELMDTNNGALSSKIIANEGWSGRTSMMGEDFLSAYPNIGHIQYDRIIANPPFDKNKDIDHIYQMYRFCKPGGRIVTIASMHWITSTNQKEKTFKKWLTELGTQVIELQRGDFKKSGTMIQAVILVIDKPNIK